MGAVPGPEPVALLVKSGSIRWCLPIPALRGHRFTLAARRQTPFHCWAVCPGLCLMLVPVYRENWESLEHLTPLSFVSFLIKNKIVNEKVGGFYCSIYPMLCVRTVVCWPGRWCLERRWGGDLTGRWRSCLLMGFALSDRYSSDLWRNSFRSRQGIFIRTTGSSILTCTWNADASHWVFFFFSVYQKGWSIKLKGVVRFFFTFVTLIYDWVSFSLVIWNTVQIRAAYDVIPGC